jgi:hypothetical protein
MILLSIPIYVNGQKLTVFSPKIKMDDFSNIIVKYYYNNLHSYLTEYNRDMIRVFIPIHLLSTLAIKYINSNKTIVIVLQDGRQILIQFLHILEQNYENVFWQGHTISLSVSTYLDSQSQCNCTYKIHCTYSFIEGRYDRIYIQVHQSSITVCIIGVMVSSSHVA